MSSYYQRHWYQKWWGAFIIVLLILVAIVTIASTFYILEISNKMKSGELEYNQASGRIYNAQTTREGEAKYWLGAQNPQLVIVEWSDFNCPYCKEAFATIKDIAQTYQGSVKIIHRDFPFISPDSLTLALAARCAGEQGRFWAMAENLFNQQKKFSMEELPKLVSQVGANQDQFITCMAEERYLNEIKADIDDAEALDIKATPTYTVGEYKMEGLMSKRQFELVIENTLNNLK